MVKEMVWPMNENLFYSADFVIQMTTFQSTRLLDENLVRDETKTTFKFAEFVEEHI